MNWSMCGYSVDGLLGTGSTGQVWRARRMSTGTPVALKRIEVHDERARSAVQSEIRALAQLDHPALIRLYEVHEDGSACVLVLELAEGGSLAQLLRRRGRLSPGEVVGALAPVAQALAHAHRNGIIHADVSSANVLFSGQGEPRLADLGVARAIGEPAMPRTTVAYVAPEVAGGGAPTPASDIFMLCAVAVHAATGHPLWSGSSPDEVQAQAAGADTVRVDAMLADVTPMLADVLARGLAIDPSLRPTGDELALDLGRAASATRVELGAGTSNRPDKDYVPGHLMAGNDVPVPPIDDVTEPGPSADARLISSVRQVLREADRPARARRSPLAIAVAAGVVVAGLAAAAGAVVLVTSNRGGSDRPVSAASKAATSSAATSKAATSDAAPSKAVAASTSAGREPFTATDGASALSELDALREQAFASRTAALLDQVYEPGHLLDEDAALLGRIVPPGCGLQGARTTFGAVTVVDSAPARPVVSVTASLAPTTLVCSGADRGEAPGLGPTRMQIALVVHNGHYRIASQQPV